MSFYLSIPQELLQGKCHGKQYLGLSHHLNLHMHRYINDQWIASVEIAALAFIWPMKCRQEWPEGREIGQVLYWECHFSVIRQDPGKAIQKSCWKSYKDTMSSMILFVSYNINIVGSCTLCACMESFLWNPVVVQWYYTNKIEYFFSRG